MMRIITTLNCILILFFSTHITGESGTYSIFSLSHTHTHAHTHDEKSHDIVESIYDIAIEDEDHHEHDIHDHSHPHFVRTHQRAVQSFERINPVVSYSVNLNVITFKETSPLRHSYSVVPIPNVVPKYVDFCSFLI